MKMIPVAEPSLDGNEERYVMKALRSGWVSSKGEYIERFAESFADLLGMKYAVSVSNGTAALHLALDALGISAGDEVIVPDLTFAATANAVLYTGARPVLVDIDPMSLTMDWQLLEKKITSKTKAIIPVHLVGRPCHMTRIKSIAKKYHLFLVEDAAEAHGAKCGEKYVGCFGDVGCFSFFGNKIITSGEGGICVTNNRRIAERIRTLRDHGMDPRKKYWHSHVGYNYRMTNLQAALGMAQLERVHQILDRKKALADRYNEFLSNVPGIHAPVEGVTGGSVCWIYYIFLIHQQYVQSRKKIMQMLADRGIETRPFFYPLHIMPPYRTEEEFPVSVRIGKSGIFLPSSINLSKKQIDYVCTSLIDVLKSIR